ncbi:MAG: hypothetical protein A3J30_00475 [Candidatus Wildermuthbacteria bacterium RIFCSPLOWO2_02_FULL_47_9c]|uniref:DUF1097 domain-containing protein n=1 Tax=Candidatus Wildermuthbacteria bacterium RIFCSPLOWO2_02_FULL_47_9c TaxID=1802466 RepID=A0A1G2RUH4_9BACT|nr:MAG: hypothetical protein UY53_C0003G0074 [Parcubacteria group bacterium GW2011_GWA2_50_10]OHA61459.1 MAG: hypothetical protein A2109_01095 [Candidatus Wildermuthbacteria bacterium GWA1_49_26]OHA66198.1 MAG: hypothetical protein A2674_01940 [Candidatus Wildermuthbacteria bacterium RIFCSPHIGHO2_01_FULL_50_47]OHA69797.1 MAG: hypothetical protein A3D63_00960 [Candidatus Wildermuthbacteria bacterium RIFCSPHIGHO2_02_FULL_49_17]OHA71665.1 MAG: hypothetical protein A3E08_01570 [Candidatus Wildermut
MTFGKFLPVAASVGVLAALWVAVGSAYALVLWVPFLSWALVFGAGAGKLNRVPKEVIGLVGGTVAGVLVVYLLPAFTSVLGGTLALPVLIFIAGTLIVLLELTNWFELAPAYFFSFAGFFAYLFGGFAGEAGMTVSSVLMYVALLVLGTALGIATIFLRKFWLDMMKVPMDQRQTIFDKERG